MANKAKIKGVHFGVGDLIKVYLKIQEGDKIRTQLFEGLVISIRGRRENKMFTVRRVASGGIGVERIFPLNSPWIIRIEIKKRGLVRRAKLYYLRDRIGKGALKVKVKKSLSKKKEKKNEKKKLGKPRRKNSRKVSS
jgi:large subunit ribosomal protein L19